MLLGELPVCADMPQSTSRIRFPDRVVVDGATEASTPVPQGGDDDDFFSSWNKPATPKSPAVAAPKPVAPPIIGRSASASANSESAPRTISSSSLRPSSATPGSRPTSKLGASRLNSSSSTTTTTSTATTGASAPKKSKLGGLGAKKAAAPIDFEEAERRAAAEAERVRQLGYDREKEKAEEERARKEAEASASAAAAAKAKATTQAAPAPVKPKGSAQDMERLGMGMKRLGFGAVPAAANSSRTSSAVEEDAPTFAREKFGAQKAISSDMYFGRNAYDPAAVTEAQTRLQSFQGATSISSNQYFGREEEDDMNGGLGPGADGALLGDGTLAGLELAAKDAISRVLANPDVQQAGESIRAGALKLADYLAQMSER